MGLLSVRRAGQYSLLVCLTDIDSVLELHAKLETDPLPQQVEVLPASETVLVTFASCVAASSARRKLLKFRFTHDSMKPSGALLQVPVLYEGADLDYLADLLGYSRHFIVQAHTAQIWTAAFTGFTPGFAYLVGENSILDVPQRETPHANVAEGSVAVGGGYSAVYPRQSSGSWHILGQAHHSLWNEQPAPSVLRPQDRVQFVATRSVVEVTSCETDSPDIAQGAAQNINTAARGLLVEHVGLLATVQDEGREGHSALGICRSGALDWISSRHANALLGNPRNTPVIEAIGGQIRLLAHGSLTLAVCGGEAEIRVYPKGTQVATNSLIRLSTGQAIDIGRVVNGNTVYIGVQGGFSLEKTLGSCSTDTFSGLGPRPLEQRSFIPLCETAHFSGTATEQSDKVIAPSPSPLVQELRFTFGPRNDFFDQAALRHLVEEIWTVEISKGRREVVFKPAVVDPQILRKSRNKRLVKPISSEGLVPGSVRFSPEGNPRVYLFDHPVTSTEPIPAVIIPEDIPVLAQLAPGRYVKFTQVLATGPTPREMSGLASSV